MATTYSLSMGALSRFLLEILCIDSDFALGFSKRDYYFEVEANRVLRISTATTSLPRPTPVIAHVCEEMRDCFLESHTTIYFTCAVYTRTSTEVRCWEEKPDSQRPPLANLGRLAGSTTNWTGVYEKQEQPLLLSVEPYHVTAFVRLVEAERDVFIQRNPDKKTLVYPRDFYDQLTLSTRAL